MSTADGIPGSSTTGNPADAYRVGSWDVGFVAETGSTNDDLVAAVESGAIVSRTVLRTDHQVAGRGRLDRRWDAPPGSNLLVSLLFPDDDVPAVVFRLTQLVALGAVAAIEDLASGPVPELGLKWPNDLMLGDRKLAGVLAQRSATTGSVVVGIGLNVGWAPESAASLEADLDLGVTPDRLLVAMLHRIDDIDPADVEPAYRERLSTLGREVRVLLPDDAELRGRAVDVDPSGRLVVETADARRHVLDVADVVHLRPT